jgi:hypothetical protein
MARKIKRNTRTRKSLRGGSRKNTRRTNRRRLSNKRTKRSKSKKSRKLQKRRNRKGGSADCDGNPTYDDGTCDDECEPDGDTGYCKTK